MNSADYVSELTNKLKNQGVPLSDVAWQTALACVGWPYVYGASGQECKPSNRKVYADKFYLQNHETIVTRCQALSWDKETAKSKITGNCKGCKWNLPVRMYDCRGFTYWILYQAFGWKLQGGGATSQWNTADNWSAKGTIDTIPEDTLVCLFVHNDKKDNMSHTGLGYHGATVEASSNVQYFETRNKKWTHWAVPKCVNAEPIPIPEGYAEVTGKNVALREEPSTKATIIIRIKTGEQVKLTTPPPSEWDYVTYKGKKGYMMKKYLKEG